MNNFTPSSTFSAITFLACSNTLLISFFHFQGSDGLSRCLSWDTAGERA